MTTVRASAICTLALLLVAGCGSDAGDSPDTASAGDRTEPPADGSPGSGVPTDDGSEQPTDGEGDGPAVPPDGDGTDAADGSTTGVDGSGEDASGTGDSSGTDGPTDDEAADDDAADGPVGDPADAPTGDAAEDPAEDDGADGEGAEHDTAEGDGAEDDVAEEDAADGDADDGAAADTGEDADRGDDDAVAPDLINADNYVSLTEFAVRMNLLVLADRAPSPTGFLARFPPDVGALIETAENNMVAAAGSVSVAEDCALGGGYEANVTVSPLGFSYRIDYDDCATERGTLDGDYSVGSAPRESDQAYDLEYRVEDGANGPGTTVFAAVYARGEFGNIDAEIERYARDMPNDPFAVRGSVGRDPDLQSAGDVRVYGTRTTIWFESEGRSIDLNVSVNRLTLSEGRAIGGTISLAAQDGSRVDVGVPDDASGTVSLTRTDRAGETFVDTVAWSEIYRPPE